MATVFILSTRIVFWGDQLNPLSLLEEMKLNPKFCELQVLGEEIPLKKSAKKNYTARTGCLVFSSDRLFPNDLRNPEKQLDYILSKLKNIKGQLDKDFKVDSATLFLSIYYGEPKKEYGQVEFLIPADLQTLLTKHNIGISILALP